MIKCGRCLTFTLKRSSDKMRFILSPNLFLVTSDSTSAFRALKSTQVRIAGRNSDWMDFLEYSVHFLPNQSVTKQLVRRVI